MSSIEPTVVESPVVGKFFFLPLLKDTPAKISLQTILGDQIVSSWFGVIDRLLSRYADEQKAQADLLHVDFKPYIK